MDTRVFKKKSDEMDWVREILERYRYLCGVRYYLIG